MTSPRPRSITAEHLGALKTEITEQLQNLGDSLTEVTNDLTALTTNVTTLTGNLATITARLATLETGSGTGGTDGGGGSTSPTPTPTAIRLEADTIQNTKAQVVFDAAASGGNTLKLGITDAGTDWAVPAVDFVPGKYTIRAYCRPQPLEGDPILALKLNGVVVNTVSVSGTAYVSVPLGAVDLAPGNKLEVVFTNDKFVAGNDDRNVFLDYLDIVPGEMAGQAPTDTVPAADALTVQAESAGITRLGGAQVRTDDLNAQGGAYLALTSTGDGGEWTATAAYAGDRTFKIRARQRTYLGNAIISLTRVRGGVATVINRKTLSGSTYGSFILGNSNVQAGDVYRFAFENDLYEAGGRGGTNDRDVFVDFFVVQPGIEQDTTTDTGTVDPTPPTTFAVLSDPNATTEARKLYTSMKVLHTRTTQRLLLTQNAIFNNGGGPQGAKGTFAQFMEALKTQAGAYPSGLGGGLIADFIAVGDVMVSWMQAGGYVCANAHWVNPWLPTTSAWLPNSHWENNSTSVEKPDILQLLRSAPDSAHKRKFWEDVNKTCDVFARFQILKLPVLFKLFHEQNLFHFWWGSNSAKFPSNAHKVKALWIDVRDYMVNVRGLHNLLFGFAPSCNFGNTDGFGMGDYSNQIMFAYPGHDKCDWVGWDRYHDSPLLPRHKDYTDLVATGKPIYVHEQGPSGYGGNWDIAAYLDTLQKNYPRVVGVEFWHSWSAKLCAMVDNIRFKEALADPRIITRDKMGPVLAGTVTAGTADTSTPTTPTTNVEATLQADFDFKSGNLAQQIYDNAGKSNLGINGTPNYVQGEGFKFNGSTWATGRVITEISGAGKHSGVVTFKFDALPAANTTAVLFDLGAEGQTFGMYVWPNGDIRANGGSIEADVTIGKAVAGTRTSVAWSYDGTTLRTIQDTAAPVSRPLAINLVPAELTVAASTVSGNNRGAVTMRGLTIRSREATDAEQTAKIAAHKAL